MNNPRFENETIALFIKCFRALGMKPGVVEACFCQLQGQEKLSGGSALSEQEIQSELKEWLEGYEKTGNPNFQTKLFKESQKKINQSFDED